ncbi:WWP2 ligase, partial [Polypterus senegalus]
MAAAELFGCRFQVYRNGQIFYTFDNRQCLLNILDSQVTISVVDTLMNVTPQTNLDLKVWSCHTLRNELLGTASIDVYDTLKNNNGKTSHKNRNNDSSQSEDQVSLASTTGVSESAFQDLLDVGLLVNGLEKPVFYEGYICSRCQLIQHLKLRVTEMKE